jgi:hypothetical protein
MPPDPVLRPQRQLSAAADLQDGYGAGLAYVGFVMIAIFSPHRD